MIEPANSPNHPHPSREGHGPVPQLAPLVNNLRESDTNQQLSLFPNQRLFCVSNQSRPSNRKQIRLPRSILTIKAEEELNQFLSRVAAAAMNAATRSYGSPALAARRLGTSDE